MAVILNLCGILGIFCLIYYLIIIIYAGLSSAFAWFWLFVSVVFLGLFLFIKMLTIKEIIIPKYLKTLFFAVVICGGVIFILIEGIIIFSGNKKPSYNADYILVLGAQIRGREITNSLKKRLDTAVSYLEKNNGTKVIVSGGKGNGEDISEAEAMRKYLLEKGISDEKILVETESTNTYENIIYSKAFLETGNESVIIVTNRFHVFRGTSIAKKQGIKNVQGLSASSDKILALNYYVREALAVIKDKICGNM